MYSTQCPIGTQEEEDTLVERCLAPCEVQKRLKKGKALVQLRAFSEASTRVDGENIQTPESDTVTPPLLPKFNVKCDFLQFTLPRLDLIVHLRKHSGRHNTEIWGVLSIYIYIYCVCLFIYVCVCVNV